MPDFVSTVAPTLLNGERLYSPAAAAKASNIPGHRGGTHLNGATIFRHIVKGVRASSGEVIRLEAIRIGHRWLTSLEAISRFTAKLTAAALPSDAPPALPAPTPRQRQRAANAASREADAIFGHAK